MPLGNNGETCAEAIRESVAAKEVVLFETLYRRVKAKGNWQDETIWQHLMSCVVNLPAARKRSPGRRPFLFLRPDGQYELYDAKRHPRVVEA